jgi:hypothetical protein
MICSVHISQRHAHHCPIPHRWRLARACRTQSAYCSGV